MLTADERIENIESALVDLSNKYNERATDDELEAVRSEIFDEKLRDLNNEVLTLKRTLEMIKEILATAQGK